MPYLRFEDDDDSSLGGTITSALLGAVAGFAVGMLVAQRVGGFSGLVESVKRRSRPEDDEVEAAGRDGAATPGAWSYLASRIKPTVHR
jgi:hypothetical protein